MKSEKGISLVILLLIVIVLLIGAIAFMNIFNSNSSTDTDSNTTNKKYSEIIGSWQADAIIYTFNEDGSATLSGQGIITQSYTYKISSNTLSLTNIETNASIEVEYSIVNDTLYIGSVTYTKVK